MRILVQKRTANDVGVVELNPLVLIKCGMLPLALFSAKGMTPLMLLHSSLFLSTTPTLVISLLQKELKQKPRRLRRPFLCSPLSLMYNPMVVLHHIALELEYNEVSSFPTPHIPIMYHPPLYIMHHSFFSL